MNKVNFNSLKNFKAPQEWIDQAAAIPESCPRRAGVSVYRVTAAAGIVLVSMIGLLIFLFFGKSAPVAVRSSETFAGESAASVASSAFATQAGYETVKPSPSTDAETLLPAAVGETPTNRHGQPVTESKTAPTEKRVHTAAAPTTGVKSTQKPATVTESAETPTQGAPLPTASVPTDAPVPTFPPTPTDPPPTPTESHGEAVEGVLCFTAVFPASLIEEGEPIYCIFHEEGTVQPEFNADEVDCMAQYTVMDNGMVFACYEVNVPMPSGSVTYQYLFLQKGKVLASGTQAV